MTGFGATSHGHHGEKKLAAAVTVWVSLFVLYRKSHPKHFFLDQQERKCVAKLIRTLSVTC